jgi:hypothetical protein
VGGVEPGVGAAALVGGRSRKAVSPSSSWVQIRLTSLFLTWDGPFGISSKVQHSQENPGVAFSVYLVRSDPEEAPNSRHDTGQSSAQWHYTSVDDQSIGKRASSLGY